MIPSTNWWALLESRASVCSLAGESMSSAADAKETITNVIHPKDRLLAVLSTSAYAGGAEFLEVGDGGGLRAPSDRRRD
jgi:hypothetical protein